MKSRIVFAIALVVAAQPLVAIDGPTEVPTSAGRELAIYYGTGLQRLRTGNLGAELESRGYGDLSQ